MYDLFAVITILHLPSIGLTQWKLPQPGSFAGAATSAAGFLRAASCASCTSIAASRWPVRDAGSGAEAATFSAEANKASARELPLSVPIPRGCDNGIVPASSAWPDGKVPSVNAASFFMIASVAVDAVAGVSVSVSAGDFDVEVGVDCNAFAFVGDVAVDTDAVSPFFGEAEVDAGAFFPRRCHGRCGCNCCFLR